ncbi:CBS domain-containing protein, partial [Stenotrophomonas sp. 3diitr2024]|uniref:CBS domain-containing protein n=1 Tax=Stenotrophomonas sp. 3diitr2024 TaxID=3345115 RepID=UPI0035C99EDE
MTTVRQLLDGKSPEVHAVAPDAAVIDAIRLMAEKGIGAVLVMDGPRLVGILSERDYARKIVLRDRSSRDTAVAEIMTSQVVTVSPGEQVEHCLQLVTDYRIRHLPVVEGAQVLVKALAWLKANTQSRSDKLRTVWAALRQPAG